MFKDMGKRLFAVARFAAALLFAIPLHVAADVPGSQLPQTTDESLSLQTQRTRLKVLDIKFDAMKQMVAAASPLADQLRDTDFRGRTMSDDWRDYILTSDSLAAIAKLHQAAIDSLDRGDLQTSALDIGNFESRIKDEVFLGEALTAYWQKLGSHPPNWTAYDAMLRANGIQPHYAANFESLERTFALEVTHGKFVQAMWATYPKIKGLREQAAAQGSAALEALVILDEQKRLYPSASTTECSPAATKTSGRTEVKVDPTATTAKLAYPIASKRTYEEGRVLVGVIVTKEGCVRLASVFASSGYERLDQAAVQYAAQMRFLPADQDGVAIEHSAVVPINFKLSKTQ
jgi:TonB family protein